MSQAQERFELRFDHSLIREALKKNLKIQLFFGCFRLFSESFGKILEMAWKCKENILMTFLAD